METYLLLFLVLVLLVLLGAGVYLTIVTLRHKNVEKLPKLVQDHMTASKVIGITTICVSLAALVVLGYKYYEGQGVKQAFGFRFY